MRNLITILLIVVGSFSLKGQFSVEELDQLDSINALINNKASHDTTLAKAYVSISDILYVSNVDTVIPLCEKAKKISEQNLTQQISEITKRSFLISLADALNNIGYVYAINGETSKCLNYYGQSLNIRKEIGDEIGVATSLNNIGLIYDEQGNIVKAIEYFHESLKIQEKIGDKSGVGTSLNNIGFLYDKQGDHEKALEAWNNSLNIRTEIGDKHGIAQSFNNLANMYTKMGDVVSALDFYKKSMVIHEATGNKIGLINNLLNIGFIYYSQGNIDTAITYYQRSLRLSEKLNEKQGVIRSLIGIGNIEIKKGNYNFAIDCGEKALVIAKNLGYTELIKDASKMSSNATKNAGDFQKSLEMFELYIQMRDSINNNETQKATIRQQTKYEFEKEQLLKEQQDKETLRLEDEKTKRRDNLQYSIILVGILAIFGLVLSLGFVSISPKFAEGLIFFAFLILFEFLLVLSDPYVDGFTGGEPMYKLLLNAMLAGLIFPAHSFFERRLKKRLIDAK